MNAYLRVKTKIENANLKKDLNEAKRELQKFKKDTEKLNNQKLEIEAKLNLDDDDYKRKLDAINRKRQIELNANTNSSGIIDSSKELKINNKYDSQITNLGLQREKSIAKAEYELEKIEAALERNKNAEVKWNEKIDETTKKLEESNEKVAKTDLKSVSGNIDNVGNSITSIIKQTTKWALAVFGVRSAYNAVRSAASTLSQYNKQIGTDLEYIKYMLSTSFEGIIQRLIQGVYTLMAYVKYLAKLWFNIDLFTKKQADRFKSANKEAKKLNNTLADFDEIKTLSDNSDSSSDKGSGIATPSVNLDKIEIPQWLKDLAKFFEPVIEFFKKLYEEKGVIGVIEGIALAFVGWQIIKSIAEWIKNFGSASKDAGANFTGLLDGLGKAVEIFALLGGLSLVIESICDLIDSFAQSGMTLGEVAGLLGIVLGELAVSFIVLLGAMTALEPSWQSIAAAAVIFAGLALVIKSVSELIDVFANSGLSLNDVIGLMTTILVSIVGLMGAIVLLGPAMTAGLGPFLVVVAAISAILIVMAATLPTILDAVGKFINEIAPSLVLLITTINECINNTIIALGTVLPPIINSVGNLFTKIFSGISQVIKTVGDTIVNIMNTAKKLITTVLKAILDFINKLGPAINNFVDNAILAVTKLINFLVSGIEYMINTLIINAINGLLNALNKIPGVDFDTIKEVKIKRFKPQLMETGGIIDVPKRGVPLASNVVGGEAGAEGVLPLTNTSTMQELGKEIGKWIGFNINFNGSLSQLARILKPEIEREQNRVGTTLIGGI